jgi:DNA-binding transcriptional regulator YiaG
LHSSPKGLQNASADSSAKGDQMTAKELLAAVRAAQALPSNYALAKLLDTRENTLWRWNSGKNTPDDKMASHLATLAGLDPDVVVAAMQAQRASEPVERARWERIADRLKTAPALAVLVPFLALAALAFPGDAQALASACVCITLTTAWGARQLATQWKNSRTGAFVPVTV